MADETPTLPAQSGKAIGQSGTLIFQGIITSEEYNRDLTGHAANRKFDIMRRSDSTVRQALLVTKLPILAADWKVEAAQDSEGNITDDDQKIANFVNRELFKRNIKFKKKLREACTMLDFGHSVFEKLFELTTDEDGKTRIGLKDLQSRKQISIYNWKMPDGSPGITQNVAGFTAYIPREKLAVFTNDQEGENYEGISLLRYAYKDWDIKDKITIVNAIAIEKMGIGVPVISAKDNQTPTPKDLSDAEETVRNFRANEEAFLKVPSTMTLEMLDMKSNSTKEAIPTLNYHDSRIMKSILAGFLEIGGQSGSGSQSLATDLSSLFMKAEEATADILRDTFQEDVINQLVDLNYSKTDNGYPQLSYGSISDDDLVQLATALGTLADKQLITPDLDTEAHLRSKYRLPALSKEAKDAYSEKQKLAREAAKNLASGMPPTANPDGKPVVGPSGKPVDENADPTLEKDAKDTKEAQATALDELKKARTKTIEVAFLD